jgi:non-ribosomal peptide synthetase component F
MADSPTTTTEDIKNQLAKYSPEKLRILARRLSKQKSAPRREQIQRSEPGCNSFPLSYAQEGFWFLEQLTPANPALSWQFAFRMQMPMDAQLWKLGFKKLAERQAILRTRYMIRDGSPVQVVESEIELPVEIVDFTDMSPQEREETVTRTLKADNLGFHVDAGPLWRAKLMKLSEDSWVLSGAIHHSIVDAWSSTVFVGELSTITATLAGGRPLRMTELPIQYGDYAKWQRGWLQGKAVQDLVAWWKRQLHGIVDIQLPLDHPRPPAQRLRQGAESVLLPKRLGDRVREFSQRAGATPFMTYFAAFKTLLMRYSGQTDLAVMVPSANRERIELEGMIGLFVNTLIVRTDLAKQPTFRELVGRVRQSMVASLSHQDLPFEMLVRELRVKRELDRNPLCQVSFQLEDIPAKTSPSQGERPAITPIEVETGASVYDLNLHLFESWDSQMIERPEGTRAVMFYDPDLFEAETIRRMLDCYVVLLNSAMSSPDTNVCELQMISQFDQHRYCVEWNESRVQYTETTIPERFEELVESEPEHVAIESADRALTRRELNESANRLARHLRLIGVGPDCPVAVAANGIDAIIAMLAIWKAGGCVVVLATEEVGARWKATLQLTKTPLTITQTVFRDKLSDYDGKVVVLEDVWVSIARHSTTNLRKLSTEQNLAFILPAGRKAILVEHHSAAERVEWLNTQHALRPGDGVLHSSSLAVDGGVQDILWGLLGRGRLVIADDERCTNANDLDRLIRQKNVRVAHLSAEAISDFLSLPFETSSSEALPLRWLLCTSDRPLSSLLQAAADRFQCPVCHIYAPPQAATTATVTYYRPGDSASGAITQRTGNVSVYVLEPSLQPTPPGMTGEIYLAGKNLARGYLDGSQEAQCFPASPFRPGEKLFRTAEFARTRNDGTLQLLGSGYGHAWRHGQRVEADEIAIALQQEPTVADCTVLALEAPTATRLLVAYVVTDGPWLEERLQAHLRSMLPEWMLPDVYMRVSRIPLLPTGKIDHKQLAAIELIDEKVAASWEAQLLAEPEVQHAAVLLKEEVEEMALLRMDDLTEATPKKAAPISIADRSPKLSASGTTQKTDPTPNQSAAVSLAEGGPLGETKFRILPELLENASRGESSIGITYLQPDGSEISCSYRQLLDDAQRVLAGLRHHGLQPGTPVIFQLDRNSDFVAAFWGCVLGGYVPVPISIAPTYKSANSITSKLVHASEMLNRPLVLSSQPLAQLVADSARFHEAEPFPVVKIEDLLQFPPDRSWHKADPRDVVLMLLTSGSTGKPKAVQLCHRNLIAMSTAAARMNEFNENDVYLK